MVLFEILDSSHRPRQVLHIIVTSDAVFVALADHGLNESFAAVDDELPRAEIRS